jgi:hypothetical protein
MTNLRVIVLVFGPLPILAGSLGLARWAKTDGAERAQGNHVLVSRASTTPSREWRAPRPHAAFDLSAACRQTALKLQERLGDPCHVIERPPFVIAGDLSTASLAAWYENTIGPATRAMAHAYFRVPPDEPITVLLFSGEHSYDRYAKALYGDSDISIYGYYKRGQRVLVMNAATGAGTMVHELTHALADFDCPHIPDWFNEGLASLHEQCRIRQDEMGIDGMENWRLPKLQQAVREKRLRSLESLIDANDFRMHDLGLNYAQARYFCLWLQRLGLLEEFFHRWRAGQAADPLGTKAALAMFPGKTWEQIDADFQAWVLTLSWQPTMAATPPAGQ